MTDLLVIVCVAFDQKLVPADLREFKKALSDCPEVDAAVEVAGTFDLIFQMRVSSLDAYTEMVERCIAPMRPFVSRIEASFVSRKLVTKAVTSRTLWVPCESGRQCIACSTIDKVIAERDYMRLFVGQWHCLIHDTMKHLYALLDPLLFIQLHRSCAVRVDFIERLQHIDQRWWARLRDGSQEKVAKSHVSELLSLIDSSTEEAASSVVL